MKYYSIFVFVIVIFSAAKAQDCMATLTISSNTDDAEYYINDSSVGIGRIAIVKSDTGKISITARQTGKLWNPVILKDSVYASTCGEYKINFVFNDNSTGDKNYFLAKVPAEETSFYEKSLFKYLLGGILVFGGTTAYYKLRADDKYSEYLSTGSQSILDEVRRYDLISGIAFGALQINFGILLYYFLSE